MQRTGLLQTPQEWKIQQVLMGKYFNNKSLEPARPNPPCLASCSPVLLGFPNPSHRQPFCKHLVIQQRRLKFISWAIHYPRRLGRHHRDHPMDFQLSRGLLHVCQQKHILKREGSFVVAAAASVFEKVRLDQVRKTYCAVSTQSLQHCIVFRLLCEKEESRAGDVA